jgi:hypothetical protein
MNSDTHDLKVFLLSLTEPYFGKDQRLTGFRATGFTLHLYLIDLLTSHASFRLQASCYSVDSNLERLTLASFHIGDVHMTPCEECV